MQIFAARTSHTKNMKRQGDLRPSSASQPAETTPTSPQQTVGRPDVQQPAAPDVEEQASPGHATDVEKRARALDRKAQAAAAKCDYAEAAKLKEAATKLRAQARQASQGGATDVEERARALDRKAQAAAAKCDYVGAAKLKEAATKLRADVNAEVDDYTFDATDVNDAADHADTGPDANADAINDDDESVIEFKGSSYDDAGTINDDDESVIQFKGSSYDDADAINDDDESVIGFKGSSYDDADAINDDADPAGTDPDADADDDDDDESAIQFKGSSCDDAAEPAVGTQQPGRDPTAKNVLLDTMRFQSGRDQDKEERVQRQLSLEAVQEAANAAALRAVSKPSKGRGNTLKRTPATAGDNQDKPSKR